MGIRIPKAIIAQFNFDEETGVEILKILQEMF
jgi:hypothetical protein